MAKKDLRPNSFNFARRGAGRLLSNDFSMTAELSSAGLTRFAAGKKLPAKTEAALTARGFYAGRLDFASLLPRHFAALLADWKGPRVHIVSVTSDCDHACLYCSAGAGRGGRHMTRATAGRTLDFIFSTGSPELVIEFQGGEPLRNFAVVKYMIGEARRRAGKDGRKLHFSMVSNLAGLTADKLEYLAANGVALCTSLDGPAALHDKARKYAGGSSHAAAARGIAMVNKMAAAGRMEPLNAICTVTKFSLPYPERIVDEFLRLGIKRVQLGPLEPIGRAAGGELAVTPEEFLAFYRRALEYMLKLHRRGDAVYEKGALMFLKQIVAGERPRYQNLDILYRLSYSSDGSVYGSDEARLLGAGGSDLLRLGSVSDSFRDIVLSPLARTLILSCFPRLAQPRCARCPYSGWCRVSPAYNLAAQGGFWGDMMTSARCAVFMGVSDLLMEKLKEPGSKKILESWAADYQ
jgi:sulfatase maturation enzyme AslB (radical SAM superfamily)